MRAASGDRLARILVRSRGRRPLDHTPRHSILPTDSVLIDRCGAGRHVELIPSGYNSYFRVARDPPAIASRACDNPTVSTDPRGGHAHKGTSHSRSRCSTVTFPSTQMTLPRQAPRLCVGRSGSNPIIVGCRVQCGVQFGAQKTPCAAQGP